MDMVKKYLLRLPEGLVTLEKEELVRRVKERVFSETGTMLAEEIRYIGEF